LNIAPASKFFCHFESRGLGRFTRVLEDELADQRRPAQVLGTFTDMAEEGDSWMGRSLL
jgi:hypothetical protein